MLLLGAATALQAGGTFSITGSLAVARDGNTATLLPNGKVLVAGGSGTGDSLNSSELYDPATGAWVATGNLAVGRSYHTATLLPNGKVLVAGGDGGGTNTLSSSELYDPATGTWTATGSLTVARFIHTATLLPNGKVLVAGGWRSTGYLNSAELYDPATGNWTATGSLAVARGDYPATLLPNGKVLVAGGQGNSGNLSSAELYDPATGNWTATGSLAVALRNHTGTLLPNGKVLIAGGEGNGGNLSGAELYDPATGNWTATGSLAVALRNHTGTLLPNGKVLIAGGEGNGGNLSGAELYDPATGNWTATGSLSSARYSHTAILLPNGKVLVAAGYGGSNALSSAELYDSSTGGAWTTTASLAAARSNDTQTLLPNGKVLVAGGYNGSYLATAALYDPGAGTWTATGSFTTGRQLHTATLLLNGKVLIVGGSNGSSLTSAQLYDPAAGTWSATGSLSTARSWHSATLLPNGKVLVAGGYNGSSYLASAELYDPASGTWSTTGSFTTARGYHTATLLLNGKVLIAGGYTGSASLSSVQLYDPASGTWSATGSLAAVRGLHAATLLPTGLVLVAGGYGTAALATCELYDPSAGTWTATGSFTGARYFHTSILLPNGNVLITGGWTGSAAVATAQVYDTGTGAWTATGSLAAARYYHKATLLPNGQVLVAGGYNGSSYVTTAQVYDVGLGFASVSQPVISTATSPVSGTSLALTGTVFTGVSEASGGGTQSSASNYPVVRLQSLSNELATFLPSDPTTNWSATSFSSMPVSGFTPGYALATVFTNGIPSTSAIILVNTTVPVIATPSVSDLSLTATSATLTGHVTSDGGEPITTRGVVYSLTSANSSPQLGGTGVTNVTSAGTTGAFTVSLSSLTPNTSYSFAVYASNSVGTAYSTAWSFTTPCQTITVTNPTVTSGTMGAAFSQSFSQSGGIGTTTFSTTSTLPTGLALSSAGVLSGTTSQAGTYAITVKATDSNMCTGTGAAYSLVIGCQTITVTNPTIATGTAGSAFSQTFSQSGGIGATTFSTTSTLPTGLSLSSAGVLSGTPAQTGSFPINVKATDSHTCSGTGAVYTLVINCQTITVTNPTVATGTVGTAFSQGFSQSGGLGTTVFSTTGTLPTGLSLSSTGMLSGTPTQTGTFAISVKATDSHACSGTGAAYTLVIGCQTITVTNPTITTGPAGVAFSQSFSQSGGVGAATFRTTSTLPTGLSLSSAGVLSGTPTQTGSFPITVKATDSNTCSGTGASYTLVISNSTIVVFNPSVTTGTVGTAFSQSFGQSGGIGVTTFSTTSALPAGLSFSSAGILAGTPTMAGSFPISVMAVDSNGSTGVSAAYALVINCQTITVANPTVTTGTFGTAFSQSFSQSGGIGTAVFSTTSTLPSGLSLSSAGVLSGTPTQAGTFSITVTATDSDACAGAGSAFQLVISGSSGGGYVGVIDSDGDGIPDAQEILNGTDPFLWDTNHDGISDGLQASSGDGTYQILVFSPGIQF